MQKKRADILLVEKGLAKSRDRAKALIMAGEVYSGVKRIDKASDMLLEDAPLNVKQDICPYVSRGGLKLEKAMDAFNIAVNGKVCADIGASTGGFTDCMLKNGAVHVFAVDVGYGQLDWKLRNDERVTVMERTNARFLTEESFSSKVEFCSVDVSFISLKLIFPAISACKIDTAVTLIKPQFEAGKEKVGKKGVVRDANVHKEVINNVFEYAKEYGYYPIGLTFSPIKGPEGNIEYLCCFVHENVQNELDIDGVVGNAHADLD